MASQTSWVIDKQFHGLYSPVGPFLFHHSLGEKGWVWFLLWEQLLCVSWFRREETLDDVEISVGFEFVNVDDVWEDDLHTLISLWL